MSDASTVLAAMGFLITVGGGCITHLYKLMYRLQEKAEAATSIRLREIHDLVERLTTRMDGDRNTLSDLRTKVAIQTETMVTRKDIDEYLTRQTKQLLDEIDRRVAWTKAPGRGKMLDD
jgi:hypothetical protein